MEKVACTFTMVFTRKKILSVKERKSLGREFLMLTVFKPLGTATFFTIFFLIILPFDPIVPDIFSTEPVNSLSKYFDQVIKSLIALPKIFLAISAIAFIYYVSREFILIIDLARDYFSLEKTLGNYFIKDKKVFLNNYYLKTSNPNFEKIKTNRTTFNKIDKEQNIDLVVSRSKRVYRFNPLTKNFSTDKLL
ncbi:hypothetical protein L1I30_09485 [Gillisia sp. M10.2A]|uniref:Uncharacterized protein n=1 Tax=Gillisia lutea TaxID=2909668 RepID=A0ABS9EK76_9FLAO|nr:hypothetical protein [Gillisia lutea]MCF4101898.1 hypothetical protein [Gillisia lutea]